MKSKQTGSSERSPIKHGLLDKTAGKLVASVEFIPWLKGTVLIDTCGGDGVSNAFSGTSSPEILCFHGQYAGQKPIEVILIEINPASVDQLRVKFGGYKNVRIIQGDYTSREVAEEISLGLIGPDISVLLHIDPNHADHVKLSMAMRRILPPSTLILTTFGCNAHGIKRLPEERRMQWMERLCYLLSVKQDRHDACLITLNRDAAQWAYLFTCPSKWKEKYDSQIVRPACIHWAKGVEVYWLSDGEKTFFAAVERLFLKVDGSESYAKRI
jgi:hypothetical protein